jgi:hypothetical protein
VRPHVELIQQADLCYHTPELPRGEGRVRQRNLSYDEENGAASTRLEFDSAWHRPGGYHHADTEWFVLRGQVKVGEQPLYPGGYFRGQPVWASRPLQCRKVARPLRVRRGTWLHGDRAAVWHSHKLDHGQ